MGRRKLKCERCGALASKVIEKIPYCARCATELQEGKMVSALEAEQQYIAGQIIEQSDIEYTQGETVKHRPWWKKLLRSD